MNISPRKPSHRILEHINQIIMLGRSPFHAGKNGIVVLEDHTMNIEEERISN